MVMEAQELVMGSKEMIMKGKRTKRQRPISPLRLAVTSTSSSSGGSGGGSGGGGSEEQQQEERIIDYNSSIEFAESKISNGQGGEEEEDMANCLILLAQGSTRRISSKSSNKASPESYNFYQCKTCNKCFSSFQALGGHRASHKKPNNINKISNYEDQMIVKKVMIMEDQEQDHVINNNNNMNMNTILSLQIPNNGNVKTKSKVHECSICGAEFSSGQALGGHMRRHRAAFASTNASSGSSPPAPEFQGSKKQRNSLQLDLNLPAVPEDDHIRDSNNKFQFGSSKEQVLVFSASSLVDCHY